jgi:hypothetical protein
LAPLVRRDGAERDAVQVFDVGTGAATALSLHLYSPPLTEMNFYD